MHRFSLFLLVSAFAASAIAQPAPMAAPAVADTGFTADGKIKLGYEGRGNYRKPKTSIKSTLPTIGQGINAGAMPQQAPRPSAAIAPTPATEAAPTEEVKKLRGDSSLSSDASIARAKREAAKPKEVAAPAAANTPATAGSAGGTAPATPAATNTPYNGLPALPAPSKQMVIVGGKLVEQ